LINEKNGVVLRYFGFSIHFTGYFKNEKKEKERKERKRGRISQQLASTQLTPPGLCKKILLRAKVRGNRRFKGTTWDFCVHIEIHSFKVQI